MVAQGAVQEQEQGRSRRVAVTVQCSGSVARPAPSVLHWSRRAAANHAVTMLAYSATIAYYHLNTG